MNEFERWSKINPLSERFLRYANCYNFGKKQKLYLVDVINRDLEGNDYFNLCVDLALKGYKLELIEAQSKYKVGVGLDRIKLYSYFELVQGQLLQKLDAIKEDIYEREKKLSEALIKLDEENIVLKSRKNAGQKPFDNKEIIIKVFEDFLKGESLFQIANYLNNNGVKTKRGGNWYRCTVKTILSNHQYVEMKFISEDTFKSVQVIFNKKLK